MYLQQGRSEATARKESYKEFRAKHNLDVDNGTGYRKTLNKFRKIYIEYQKAKMCVPIREPE
ncbi:MAG: hypothetical protein K9L78_00340 [Victivallales bacterium]|nr:hypothetical protein [Victivallales bacterium]